MLTHIDLFSGIGGFALAAQWAGFRTVVFCEIEPFCQEVLKARFGAIEDARCVVRKGGEKQGIGDKENEHCPIFPERPTSSSRPLLFPDIRDFDGRRFQGATLLTGGFPCQPFSCAGKRRGRADDRWLWPEMLRIIKDSQPHWIIAENVPGIIRMELGQVLSDLEVIGYDFPRDHHGCPIVPTVPACGLNAPHKRNRIWIIAYLSSKRKESISQQGRGNGIKSQNYHAYDTRSQKSGRLSNLWWEGVAETRKTDSDAPDSDQKRLQKREMLGENLQSKCSTTIRESWKEDWPEVATRLCRVDDGVPRRVDRLKALGNAIVPAIAYEIIKEIARIEYAKGDNQ